MGAWAPTLAAILVGACYLSTLMWQISGSDSEYTIDSGEYQVALAMWGTVHPTGTPLYMFLGSPFVAVFRWMQIPPAAGASLFSLVWASGCASLMALILVRLNVPGATSVLAAVMIGLTHSIWVHGAIPEVYSLWMFIVLFAILLAMKLDLGWSDKHGWVLAFVAGLGVAHHRLFAATIPVLILWVWNEAPRGRALWRWVLVAAMAFVAGFLPYADMILRARGGAEWIYGDPSSWVGFWSLFWAREYGAVQTLSGDPQVLMDGVFRIMNVLWLDMGWQGVLYFFIGAPFAIRGHLRRSSMFLLSIATMYILFAIALPRAVLIEAVAMLVVGPLLVVATVGIARIADISSGTRILATIGVLGVSCSYWLGNRSSVLEITRDLSGVETMAQLSDLEAPSGATIMSPWGRRHFALSYVTQVEGLYPGWRVGHHAEDWAEIVRRETVVYTNSDSIYGFGPDWWRKIIGGEPYFSSAGAGWVAVSPIPLPMTVGGAVDGEIASGIHLKGSSFSEEKDVFKAVLCWQAWQSPKADYSTFVHLASVGHIVAPEELVASSDHSIPVDGWHPTTGWRRGEVVCDAHAIILPGEADFEYVIAGMYTRNETGGFDLLGALRWVRTPTGWDTMQ